MAIGSTLYRISLELSDVDRACYESLQLRVACHPSEGPERLVARVLAYGLLFEEGLKFGKGLSDADEPALWTHDLTGTLLHWIDVGTPSAERIHVAAKKAERVSIVCHRKEELLVREMQRRKVHRAEHVSVYLLDPSFISGLAEAMDRNTEWNLVRSDNELNVSIQDYTAQSSLRTIPLPQ